MPRRQAVGRAILAATVARAMSTSGESSDRSLELSLVIPAVNGRERMDRVLAALARERSDVAMEVLVVSRLGDAFDQQLAREQPWVRILSVPRETPIPQMRARAFGEATASLVAVIEDHVVVPPGWARRAIDAASMGAVVAGPVENLATHTLADRAAFLCEYSHCLPPGPSGESTWLPGNNTVYPASLLLPHIGLAAAGAWENEIHDAIRRAGARLVFVPELVAGHDMPSGFRGYLGQRYLYARSYAGNRVRGAGPVRRVAYAVATIALPAVLLIRIARNVLRSPAYRNTLPSAVPFLSLFVVAWAVGEIMGYLAGAGDALAKVR